jgi:hypothetical protein
VEAARALSGQHTQQRILPQLLLFSLGTGMESVPLLAIFSCVRFFFPRFPSATSIASRTSFPLAIELP